MKLKTKFTLIISVIIVALSCIAFLAFSAYRATIKRTIGQQQFRMLSILADDIDSKLWAAQRQIIADAKITPPGIMRNPDAAQRFLDKRASVRSLFDNSVLLLTPAGKIFAESPYAPGRRGLDLSFRQYIIDTLKTKQPYISDSFMSSKSPSHPVLVLTVPLFDDKGKITGILAGSIDLMRDNFLGRLATAKVGEAGYFYLTTTDGAMVMHPDKKRLLTHITAGANKLLDRALTGFEGTDETRTAYGAQMVASFKRLKAKDWILAANYPQSEAYRPVIVAERYFFMGAVISMVAIFFIISFIMNNFIKPLEVFTRHIEGLSQKAGRDRLLDINTKDEIGLLSSAFNKMDTERIRAEEMVTQANLQKELLLNSAGDGIYGLDLEGRTTFANPNALQLTGYLQEEIVGRRQHDLVHHTKADGAHYPHEDCPIYTTLKDGTAHHVDSEFFWRKDGTSFPVSYTSTPIRDERGELQGAVVVFNDITERKLAEQQLRSVTQRLKLATQSADLGIWDWDITDNTMVWDARMMELYGLTPETFTGNVESWQNGLYPEDSDRVLEECKAALEGVKEWDTDFRVLHPDQTVKFIKANGIVIRDSKGTPIRMLGINFDITEHRNLEVRLRQAHKMETIGTLAGGVAHDFNNILTAIIGFATMAERRIKEDEKTEEYIKEVLLGANRAATLTQSLLAFSRKQTISLKHVDLNVIAKRMLGMIKRVIGEDIILKTMLTTNKLPVMVDESQIEQVLLNLVTNARDAMPHGGTLVIQTEEINVDSDYADAHFFENIGRCIVLTVSDTGDGMDLKTRENIFEPFFTTKEVGKGTGLGLSMAYGTIKQHNGNIEVSSEVGKGTTFKVYLPIVEKEETISEPVEVAAERGRETIILAEDEQQVRKAVRLYLEGNGYKVIEAEDGAEAVRKVKENKGKASLILLDVIMPVKNGRDAYEEIRAIDPGLKTIFMSGYTDDVISRNGILEEGLNFVSKPISPGALMKKIRNVLDAVSTEKDGWN